MSGHIRIFPSKVHKNGPFPKPLVLMVPDFGFYKTVQYWVACFVTVETEEPGHDFERLGTWQASGMFQDGVVDGYRCIVLPENQLSASSLSTGQRFKIQVNLHSFELNTQPEGQGTVVQTVFYSEPIKVVRAREATDSSFSMSPVLRHTYLQPC
jgi:hypothetical protein